MALVGDGDTRADRQPVSLNAGPNRGVRATAKRNRTVAGLSPFRQNTTVVPFRASVLNGETHSRPVGGAVALLSRRDGSVGFGG